MTNFGFKLGKAFLFTFDFVIMIISLPILGVGIWALVDSKAFVDTIALLTRRQSSIIDFYANTEFTFIAAAVMISLSIFMFLICFAGCWGVVSESRCLLNSQGVLTILLILLQTTCIATLYITRPTWLPSVKKSLTDNFDKKYVGSLGTNTAGTYDAFSLAVDAFMINFKCCGVNGPDDFLATGPSKQWHAYGRVYHIPGGGTRIGDDVEIPTACCQFNNISFFNSRDYQMFGPSMVNQLCPVKFKQDFNKKGCFDVVPEEIAKYNAELISITVVILVLELIMAILALVLAHYIKRWHDELYY